MDDVVDCILLYTVMILHMTSSTPERVRRSWFWGVTICVEIFLTSQTNNFLSLFLIFFFGTLCIDEILEVLSTTNSG